MQRCRSNKVMTAILLVCNKAVHRVATTEVVRQLLPGVAEVPK
jgi:hypothetical protein